MTNPGTGRAPSRAERERELACIEFVELVTDYLESALPDAHRISFERHLGECEGCAHYLDQMRATIAVAGQLRPEDIPDAALDRLLAAFREFSR